MQTHRSLVSPWYHLGITCTDFPDSVYKANKLVPHKKKQGTFSSLFHKSAKMEFPEAPDKTRGWELTLKPQWARKQGLAEDTRGILQIRLIPFIAHKCTGKKCNWIFIYVNSTFIWTQPLEPQSHSGKHSSRVGELLLHLCLCSQT